MLKKIIYSTMSIYLLISGFTFNQKANEKFIDVDHYENSYLALGSIGEKTFAEDKSLS